MPNVPGTTDPTNARPVVPDFGRRSTLVAGAVLLLGSSASGVSNERIARPARPNRGDRTDLGEAARLSALCSNSNAIGVGLRGEYFAEENWLGRPDATRTDPTVEFDSLHELLKASGLKGIESVRWTGWIKAHVTGRFRFDGGSPDVRVLVSNIALSDARTAAAADIQLSAGRYYPVRVELDRISTSRYPIRLQWTTPYGAHYVVPRQLLFLPTDSTQAVGR